jgi:hypothetical protein
MNKKDRDIEPDPAKDEDEAGSSASESSEQHAPTEIGGRKGPEPVRYGDWEKNGRCIDF